MAKFLAKALEPYRLMFIEEPALSENNSVLREIAQHTSIPIATGERMYTRWQFKPLLMSGAADIVQPDVSHCGGIWELRKIAAMAEAHDVAVAPHCPLGPICLAASLQIDFCTPNALIQESAVNLHLGKQSDLLETLVSSGGEHPLGYRDGVVHRSSKPGLGINIDEDCVRELAQVGHNWRSPLWRNADGSVTEW
jgi:galactonate dehydratase